MTGNTLLQEVDFKRSLPPEWRDNEIRTLVESAFVEQVRISMRRGRHGVVAPEDFDATLESLSGRLPHYLGQVSGIPCDTTFITARDEALTESTKQFLRVKHARQVEVGLGACVGAGDRGGMLFADQCQVAAWMDDKQREMRAPLIHVPLAFTGDGIDEGLSPHGTYVAPHQAWEAARCMLLLASADTLGILEGEDGVGGDREQSAFRISRQLWGDIWGELRHRPKEAMPRHFLLDHWDESRIVDPRTGLGGWYRDGTLLHWRQDLSVNGTGTINPSDAEATVIRIGGPQVEATGLFSSLPTEIRYFDTPEEAAEWYILQLWDVYQALQGAYSDIRNGNGKH